MIRTRQEALTKLRAEVDAGRPIIGAGAGTGISAKFCEKGGVDLIIIYNSGRFRMAGRGSLAGLLAYGDANAIVVDMAREVLPVVKQTPVLAGVNGTDPFRLMDVFLDDLKRMGFAGVQNFPTVGLFDGRFRQNLEETGMGYALEVEMVRLAREKELLTAPYVFNPAEAAAMARAGADIVVAHMGLTTKGSIGATTSLSLEDCPRLVQEIADSAREARPDVIVLCHGGPISEPADAEHILQHARGVHGFFGASSIERLATETAITEQARRFKSIRFPGGPRKRGRGPLPRPPVRPSPSLPASPSPAGAGTAAEAGPRTRAGARAGAKAKVGAGARTAAGVEAGAGKREAAEAARPKDRTIPARDRPRRSRRGR